MKKLCVFDLDGTLLNDDKIIEESSYDAIERLREEGYLITFATGRLPYMVEDYRQSLKVDLPIITSNGAMINSQSDTIYSNPLTYKVLRSLIDFIEKFDYPIHLYGDKGVYTKALKDIVYDVDGTSKLVSDAKINIDVVESLKEVIVDRKIYKALIPIFYKERHGKMVAFLNDLGHVDYYNHSYTLEVVAKGCSKGEGLKRLCNNYSIASKDVIVFGDSNNDESMFKEAGICIAMANSTPQLKAMAHHITKGNNEGGIAHAVHTWLI